MRRLVCFTVLGIAFAAAATGLALASSDDGTLSVKAGVGRVNLNFTGSAVGRVARGSIKVTDPIADDGLGVDVWGCEVLTHDKTDSTTLCRGTGLRFRAIGGKYQIRIAGAGIYLSAVGHGLVGLNGAGEDPNIDSDGTYSLNDQPYKSLPDLGVTLPLIAPAGG
jgi:hypothetical protein